MKQISFFNSVLFVVSKDQLVDLYYGSDPEYAEDYKTYLKDDSINAQRLIRAFKSK